MESLAFLFPFWALLAIGAILSIFGGIAAKRLGIPLRDVPAMFDKAAMHLFAPDAFKALWTAASRAFALLSFAMAIAALSPYAEKSLLFTAVLSACTFAACIAFTAYAGMFVNRLNERFPPANKKGFVKGAVWDYVIASTAGMCYYGFIRLLASAARDAFPVS